MVKERKILKVFCNACKRKTRHEVLCEKSENWGDDDEGIWGQADYQIIQCGCDIISFRRCDFGSEYYDLNLDEMVEKETLYPLRGENHVAIKTYWNVPNDLRNIYKETVEAYNNNLLLLAGVGVRTTVECICTQLSITKGSVERFKDDKKIEKVIKVSKDLDGKIAGLAEKGFLTIAESKILNNHRFLGNDSAHEILIPTQAEIKLAIEIIEHVFDTIFELEIKSQQLGRARRKRHRELGSKK
jgi:hypothetical protein